MDIHATARRQSQQITAIITGCNPANDSLFGGELAVVLYCYYLYESEGDEAYADMAIDRLEKVLLDYSEGNAKLDGPYYASGVGGLFYVLVLFAHKGLLEEEMDTVLQQLAAQLLQCAVDGINNDANDFMHGSFGLLHGLSLYTSYSKDDRLLQQLLRVIENKYLLADTPWIVSAVAHDGEKTTVNTSLAHGQAGFLVLLMKTYTQAGVTNEVKERLRRNAGYLAGLRKETLLPGNCNFYPLAVNPYTKETADSNRLAWCYGDLGLVLFLYKAAAFFDDNTFRQQADDLCIKTTKRTTAATTLTEGAQLCHGMGGLAFFYRLLGELSGLDCCTQASGYWMQHTIAAIDEELAAVNDAASQLHLLEGLPGKGLVLMSYLSEKKLDWGRLILLD
jgi:lantibiotic biosynthesis protein